jgi:uracil-DNA glycosylase
MRRINPNVVIIGEAPGPQDSGAFPLLGTNMRAAGARLRAMSGLSMPEWRSVVRVNLVSHPLVGREWPRQNARITATSWKHSLLQGKRVILLGSKVCNAFGYAHGVDHAHCEWREQAGYEAASIPHPSGRNLAYNDLAVKLAVGKFLLLTLLAK